MFLVFEFIYNLIKLKNKLAIFTIMIYDLLLYKARKPIANNI